MKFIQLDELQIGTLNLLIEDKIKYFFTLKDDGYDFTEEINDLIDLRNIINEKPGIKQ